MKAQRGGHQACPSTTGVGGGGFGNPSPRAEGCGAGPGPLPPSPPTSLIPMGEKSDEERVAPGPERLQ